ncbi:hypothetical protein FRB95_004854 [Tulasnella sp. JGI-2019a]|nr:hypothetical protein FRB95_004854 [Tulasnella sp. JGI-2019a]
MIEGSTPGGISTTSTTTTRSTAPSSIQSSASSPSSSTGLVSSSRSLSTSTTSMPPSTTRMIKQRRVSLPGTSMLDDTMVMSTTRLSSRLGGESKGSINPESGSDSRGPAVNGWGVTVHNAPTDNASSSNSQYQKHYIDNASNRSAAFPIGSNIGRRDDQPQPEQAPSSTPIVTRRRRATTVTAKGRTREFAVPANPVRPAAAQEQPAAPASTHVPTAEVAATTSAIKSQVDADPETSAAKPRKPRKRWTMEETQSLVDGCNKWGVGNWKAILNDTQFQFQGRSPVDLKDRFRTYFPDAYRTHYPNAKTHLSTRIRSFLPDGTPIFAKTRSKKRRPFSAEEDAALRRGYERYGTTWATIVKDPVFKGMERRSTDLRDRFRNAFPDLYKAAGYKPRPRAGTTSSANTESASPAPATPLPKTKDTAIKRGRKAKAESSVVSSVPTPVPTASGSGSRSRSASKSKSRVPSGGGRKKRCGGAATGERPIAPGEPTAADFYRPHSVHGDLDYEDEDLDTRQPSDSEQGGYSSEEEDQDDRYYPLSAITHQSSGSASPVKSAEQVSALAQAWTRELSGTTMTDDEDILEDEEADMDVDGDVMLGQSPLEDDGEIDGTELSGCDLQHGSGASASCSSKQASASEARTPSSALSPSSPSMPQAIQDLLNTTTAAAMLHNTGANNHNGQSSQSRHNTAADGLFSEAMAYEHNHSRQHSFLHPSTPSTTSVNNSVTSGDDWASISSSHGGGYGPNSGHNVHTNSSSHPWMSNPTSPTPSEYYPHSSMLDNHPGGGASVIGMSSNNSRIGKSAWGPQDWLSNNPRLDHNLNITGGNGALTSWPTPASDPHAVLDRYDLYSAVEAAHEFASEAAYGHGHYHASSHSHTHAYPDDSLFREFTHHRYAGDLIPGSGVAVHPPSLSLQHTANGSGGGGSWSFGALGLGLAALGGLDTGSLQDDYASSVTSGSNMGLASLRGALRDVDDPSCIDYHSGSTDTSGPTSPTKMTMSMPSSVLLAQQQQQHQPDTRTQNLDAMILVDSDEISGSNMGLGSSQVAQIPMMEHDRGSTTQAAMDMQLSIPSPLGQSMEEAGAITPTSYPASLPCPPSPLNLARPRVHTADFSNYRRNNYPSPARPHSRSVTQGHPAQVYRPATPVGVRDASRSLSQPPSEHRLALQRSLSYLDPISSSHATSAGLFGPYVDEDPLAYNEPLSISSLDLQYGMSSGPNIFTPLTMFSDPPTIAPARTINSSIPRSNSVFGNHRPTPTPPPSSNAMVDDALDLSALIHTSPIPAARNHQRHQSQSVISVGDRRGDVARKRSSWDGLQFDLLPHGTPDEAAFFLDFSRSTS